MILREAQTAQVLPRPFVTAVTATQTSPLSDDPWQTRVGCGLTFTLKNKFCRIVPRYGYGFTAIRNDQDPGDKGAHSVGVLLQCDFDQYKRWRRDRP